MAAFGRFTAVLTALALIALLVCGLSPVKPVREQVNSDVYGTADQAISLAEAQGLLLSLSNAAREEQGLGELAPDVAADRLAYAQAHEMATAHFLNHQSLNGLKCERRYNLLAQVDHVAENLAYYEINSRTHEQIHLTPQLVQRAFDHFMESPAHRAVILAAAHTQLGSAVVLSYESPVTYVGVAMELLTRVGEYEPLPLNAVSGERLRLVGQLDPAEARLLYVGLGRESLPQAQTAEHLLATASGYNQPAVEFAWAPLSASPAGLPEGAQYLGPVRYDPLTGEFELEVYLAQHWGEGLYYVTLWCEPLGREGEPFIAMTQTVAVTKLP